MNPSSPVVTSRPNTSQAIQSAHAALTEKARENAYSTNLVKRLEASPERSLIRGAAHKRMQSLHTGSVKDLSSLLENGSQLTTPKSPEKGEKRPSTPLSKDRGEAKSPAKSLCAATPTATTYHDTSNANTPTLRPSLRKPPQSILGENTPPQSATMLALQNAPHRDIDMPLSNVTNGSSAIVRSPESFDGISYQISSLTSICTNLQKEMAQLSRRSKDNATDLVSLKEATNARDEDIRKSLRDLVSNITESPIMSSHMLHGGHAGLYIDNKAHYSPKSSMTSRSPAPFMLPRIPSPTSFNMAFDRESQSTPSLHTDSVASIALLEKILREMGTKEGQETLVSRLSEVAATLTKDGITTAKRIDGLLEYIKENTAVHAMMPKGNGRVRNFSFDDPPHLELDFDGPRAGPLSKPLGPGTNKANRSVSGARGAEVINGDMLKIIKSVKDSVAQGGGLTAEVKALVRELRGEVLGMGRDIGRKLDEANRSSATQDSAEERNQMINVVQAGLDELKHTLDNVVRENRRQSAASMVSRVDYQEVYNAVRTAVADQPKAPQQPKISKGDIIEAVKEAWENYKPDIEVQQFGLEREELLATLKEGIEEFTPQQDSTNVGATRDEVFTAVVEGLKHFHPPKVETEASLSRDEILDAVRECLEEFEFPSAPAPEPRTAEICRDDMVTAVKEGLHDFDFAAINSTSMVSTQVNTITKDDIYDAIRAGLEDFEIPIAATEAGKGPEISKDDMIDAVREGLHEVDFAATTAAVLAQHVERQLSKDDIISALHAGLEDFEFPVPSANEQLMSDVLRTEILHAVREGLHDFDFTAANMNSSALIAAPMNGISRDDVYDAVRAGLETAPLPTDTIGEQVSAQLHDILETIRAEFQAVSEEAKQNVAANGRDTEQVLDATRDGFDKLRVDMESHVDRAAGISGRCEILDSIRDNFAVLRDEIAVLATKDSSNSTHVLMAEFESLRENMATSLVRGGPSVDKEEIIEALRDGLESLRADIDRPRDGNESILSGTSEILDALQDGLHSLRSDVEKLNNKPVDMTVNYEILDTLKAGLESVRADIERLNDRAAEERAVTEFRQSAMIPAEPSADNLKRNDIENLEVLITQLRIKVEAMESMPPQPAAGTVMKEDLIEIEETLRGVQEAVSEVSMRNQEPGQQDAIRADIEAVETLLRNTKAKIDELDPEFMAKKEHMDSVEVIVLEARESIENLTSHLEDVTKQEDLIALQSLVRDVLLGLADIKERTTDEAEDLEKVTKTDVQAVEAACLDLKTHIETRLMSDIADMATKSDVVHLASLLKESKDRIELHADSNVKAFEERQAEIVGVAQRITDIKVLLEDFEDLFKQRLDENLSEVQTLGKMCEGLAEKATQKGDLSEDLQDILDTMKSEFEKSNAGVVGAKLETDEKFQQTWDRFESTLTEKLDELATKYDIAQLAAEEKSKLDEEHKVEIDAALLGTKTAAEDLKLLADNLGTTLNVSVDRLDEASKTVFTRVDDTYTKVDGISSRIEDTFTRVEETHADAKSEHQLTREQVFKAISAVQEMQQHADEHRPKVLDAVKDVLLIVGQHYEHSKTSASLLQEKLAERPAQVDTPLLPEPPASEKYDDTSVHEKLDRLVDHISSADRSYAQLETLEQIHQQVIKSAAEVKDFLSAQTRRIEDEHEDKEKAAEAAAAQLERTNAQQTMVEASIENLRQEEERLRASVAALRSEQDSLSTQKSRLAAENSSLETALHIRREELQFMETRAESLERRILEGVIDHSRALLVTKANKGRDAMSRKRVPSHVASTGSVLSASTPKTLHATHDAVDMAMKGGIAGVPITNGASRRILSLNQITNNVPTGGNAFLKRSQSVKAPKAIVQPRKGSWGGKLGAKYGELNKENLALMRESDEEGEETQNELAMLEDEDRRASRGTTIMTGHGTLTTESIGEETQWTGSVSGDESSIMDESEVGVDARRHEAQVGLA